MRIGAASAAVTATQGRCVTWTVRPAVQTSVCATDLPLPQMVAIARGLR